MDIALWLTLHTLSLGLLDVFTIGAKSKEELDLLRWTQAA
jgi:hypothetical protein